MNIAPSDVEKIARLSKLQFDETAQKEIQTDLDRILNMMENLKDVNTENTEPLSHPIDQPQPLREDTVNEADERDAFQKLAPEVRGHLYVVPPVIESE